MFRATNMFKIVSLICSLGALPLVFGVTFEEDVTLVKYQVDALQEFKQRVLKKLPLSYMKEDIYLVKWLKARNYDVDKAENFLNNHLSWRKSTKFDELDENYFKDFEMDYPFEITGFDKSGKPLVYIYLDEWDIRKASVAGKLEKLNMYGAKVFEKGWEKVHEMQQQGKNVSRFTTIGDVKKINIVQHINPPSMPFFISMILSYDRSFPKMGDKIWIVNCPSVFQVAVNLVKSIADAETKEAITVFGKNQENWMTELHKHIDPSQLTARFGGTMPSKFDFKL